VIPNLFVIGAMKSATTSLVSYLAQHPQIHVGERKEPSFYTPEGPVGKRFGTAVQTREEYEALYAGAPEGTKFCVDGSTNYTKDPHVRCPAERIFKAQPDAKLIYIMRHPTQRTISHYWHAVRRRAGIVLRPEHRPMDVAIREEPIYTDLSYYARQLKPYLNCFRESLLWLTTEELVAEPGPTLQKMFEWLGLNTPGYFYYTPHHVTPAIMTAADGRKVDRFSPEAEKAKAVVADYLAPIQARQTAELESLLGTKLPWKFTKP
jgi:hypothetical protein